MNCKIYKSLKKQDTYVYMASSDDFNVLPQELINMLGKLELVMEIELTHQTKLSQESALDVINRIKENGFFIQLPRQEKKEPEINRLF